jgi:hypothetical protein
LRPTSRRATRVSSAGVSSVGRTRSNTHI